MSLECSRSHITSPHFTSPARATGTGANFAPHGDAGSLEPGHGHRHFLHLPLPYKSEYAASAAWIGHLAFVHSSTT